MQTYYVLKDERGKYKRKYFPTFDASDLSNAEIFRTRSEAVKANEKTKHKGNIFKIEVNVIE